MNYEDVYKLPATRIDLPAATHAWLNRVIPILRWRKLGNLLNSRLKIRNHSTGDNKSDMISVWFDDKPFMVAVSYYLQWCDEYDYTRYVTDTTLYSNVEKWVLSLDSSIDYTVTSTDKVDNVIKMFMEKGASMELPLM